MKFAVVAVCNDCHDFSCLFRYPPGLKMAFNSPSTRDALRVRLIMYVDVSKTVQ